MPLFKRNVELLPPLRLSSWRKIAIGTWRTVGDPSVYGSLDLDVGPALSYIEKLRSRTGVKVTLSHFAGKAFGQVMRQHPEINCILRFGRLYPRRNVDIFFQVASDDQGKDLAGVTVRKVDEKPMQEIAREMQERVQAIRDKGDQDFKKTKNLIGSLPGMLSRWLLDFSSFILYTLNLWTPLLGSPRDPFGGVMITNVGSLGLDAAFAPLVPYSRIPMLLALGVAKPVPVANDGQVAVAQTMRICCTFDHRLIDGIHAAHMTRALLRIFAEPESYFPLPP